MEHTPDLTVSTLLDRIGSASPTWAAGSVLALVAAQAWALVGMIAGLAAKRKTASELLTLTTHADSTAKTLMGLAAQDAEAVSQWMAHPNHTVGGDLIEVPLAVLRLAVQGQDAIRHPDLRGYAPASLDLACAAALFDVVVDRTRALVRANLSLIPASQRPPYRARLDALGLPRNDSQDPLA